MNFLHILLLALLLNISVSAQDKYKDLEKVSLQLQWLDQFQFAGYYMAKEKGFYEDVGLDVTIRKHSFEKNSLREVMSKRATYAIGRSTLIIDKSKGAEIVLLAALYQSSPLVLVTLKSSKIKKVEDFKGKTIMTTFNDSKVASILAMLKRHHIQESDLNILPYTYDINDLINGTTQITTAYKTNQVYKLKEQNILYTIFDPADEAFEIYGDILFTSEDEINNHPNRAHNFTQASLKGWKYAFEHMDETVAFIHANYNPQHKSLEALKFEAVESKKLAYLNQNTLGSIEVDKIKSIYYMYNIMGFINKKFDIESFIFEKRGAKHLHLNRAQEIYLHKKKEIKMCVLPDVLPLSSVENGKFIGMSADYIKLISKKIDTRFTLVPTQDWSESLAFVKQRKCDILPLAQETPSRKEYLDFSYTTFSTPLVIVTLKNKAFISDISSIIDKKIGFAKGHSHLELIQKKYPDINFIEVKNTQHGLRKVANGEIYAYVGNLASISYHVQREYANLLKVSGTVGKTIETKIAVRNDEPILLNIINRAIVKISEAEKQGIYNQWIHIIYEKGTDYALIAKITAFFLFLISITIFFIFRQNQYKKELERLTKSLEFRVKEEVAKNTKKDQKMFQQSRLAQMGELISMIAHQWRQPLSAISATSIDLKLQMELEVYDFDTKQGRDKCLREINNGLGQIEIFTQNLTQTINDFRDFYKQNKSAVYLEIKVPINKALSIIETSLITSNIKIIQEYKSSSKIELFDSELMQVVLNILKNAQDNFQTQLHKDAIIWIRTFEDETKVTLTIKDNGGGINEEILSSIFDPYFSTKKEQNGTGLGLYMSKMIIQEHHNGQLSAKNDNNGVCFCIEIPKGKLS